MALNAPRTADLSLDAVPTSAPPPDEVLAWLAQGAVPLETVEAGQGFEDLKPLAPWLSGVRVVALGEATHGTREFFQLKHRLLEYLATEHGFTVFAIEASFAEALAINEYVLTGKGDPAQALAGLYFWTWDTQEVLALIQWMRAYNANPRHPRKLTFYGFDAQPSFSAGSAKALLGYLRKVDTAYAKQVEAHLTALSDNTTLRKAMSAPDTLKPYAATLAGVNARLEGHQKKYAKKSNAQEWALASRHAYVLAAITQQAGGPAHGAANFNARDQLMADNVLWLLEQQHPEAKMVLWGHNNHVNLQGRPQLVPMGQVLREKLGDALYTFGFAFHQGAFQAMHMRPGLSPQGVIPHTVPPAPAGTLDAVLASPGLPLYVLNLRGAPRHGAVGTFLEEPRESRQVGSVYFDGMPAVPMRLAESFDGLIFVEKTRAATPMPTGRRPPPPAASSSP